MHGAYDMSDRGIIRVEFKTLADKIQTMIEKDLNIIRKHVRTM